MPELKMRARRLLFARDYGVSPATKALLTRHYGLRSADSVTAQHLADEFGVISSIVRDQLTEAMLKIRAGIAADRLQNTEAGRRGDTVNFAGIPFETWFSDDTYARTVERVLLVMGGKQAYVLAKSYGVDGYEDVRSSGTASLPEGQMLAVCLRDARCRFLALALPIAASTFNYAKSENNSPSTPRTVLGFLAGVSIPPQATLAQLRVLALDRLTAAGFLADQTKVMLIQLYGLDDNAGQQTAAQVGRRLDVSPDLIHQRSTRALLAMAASNLAPSPQRQPLLIARRLADIRLAYRPSVDVLSTETPSTVLYAALRDGDQLAYDLMYRRYYPKIEAFLRRYLVVDEIGDVAQKTFLEFMPRLASGIYDIQNDGQIGNLLKAVAHHKAVNYLRSREYRLYKATSVDEAVMDATMPATLVDSVERQIINRDRLAVIEEALLTLKGLELEIVRLRFFQQLSAEEIADIVGKEPGNVRVIQHRALGRLRKMFQQSGVTIEEL